MAQNSETVAFNAFNYVTSNGLSVILGVGSGVFTSSHSSTISVAGTLDAMYYAALGGTVSFCVKILIERAYKVLLRTWRDKVVPMLAAYVAGTGTVAVPLSGLPVVADTGGAEAPQDSHSQLIAQ